MANKIIAGDYKGRPLVLTLGVISISTSMFSSFYVNKDTVKSYEVITDEVRKSAASGIARGAVGGVLLGPIGLIGGALSAKNKGTYNIALEFYDGCRSLVEVDDKFYKQLMKTMF